MRVLIPLAIVVALAVPAQAHHCTTWSTSVTDEDTIVVDIGTDAAIFRYYVVDVCQLDGCLFSIWPYPEANGIPGLQRQDEVVDDTCHGMIEGDVIIP